MRAVFPDEIGSIARERRAALGLSQSALADSTGSTRQWLSRFEAGRSDVSLGKALEVLRELGLTVEIRPLDGGPTGSPEPTDDLAAIVAEINAALLDTDER